MRNGFGGQENKRHNKAAVRTGSAADALAVGGKLAVCSRCCPRMTSPFGGACCPGDGKSWRRRAVPQRGSTGCHHRQRLPWVYRCPGSPGGGQAGERGGAPDGADAQRVSAAAVPRPPAGAGSGVFAGQGVRQLVASGSGSAQSYSGGSHGWDDQYQTPVLQGDHPVTGCRLPGLLDYAARQGIQFGPHF